MAVMVIVGGKNAFFIKQVIYINLPFTIVSIVVIIRDNSLYIYNHIYAMHVDIVYIYIYI